VFPKRELCEGVSRLREHVTNSRENLVIGKYSMQQVGNGNRCHPERQQTASVSRCRGLSSPVLCMNGLRILPYVQKKDLPLGGLFR